MLAETLSATLIKQISPIQHFPVELGYFRSKLFITDSFTNPLIAAASPLISLLERMNIASQLPELPILYEHIQHEFKAFFSRLRALHYSEEFLTIAHYLLSATTDELLGKNLLRLSGEIQTFKAFTPITPDNLGPQEQFFIILNQLLIEPEQFLDLIELTYYCLLIGFEGKYYQQNHARIELDNLIENLFQILQKYRTNQKHKLFKNYIPKNHSQDKRYHFKTMVLSLILSLASLTAISEIWFQHEAHLLFQQQLSSLESLI